MYLADWAVSQYLARGTRLTVWDGKGWQTHFLLILTLAQTTNFIVFVSATPKPKSTLDELLQAPEGSGQCTGPPRQFEDLIRCEIQVLGPAATKRKAEDRALICVQCDSAFFEKSNDKEPCHYHWGECEPYYESDYWADHDEGSHGPIDTKENRCAWGMHEADPRKSRRECGYKPSGFDEFEDDDDDDDEDDFDEEPEFLSGNKK
ncbi:hypothetical protein FIE12Z_201 [Fusarium flagelliforme]|uniref:Uncharacterized protein n=1 Tax=Fusarium flagelliforme TaxID=2675880 RepID=A0A395N6A2_9HYPO|nr:hypothetical protein FIE12Z_201 [Fusarium flagelliforme]